MDHVRDDFTSHVTQGRPMLYAGPAMHDYDYSTMMASNLRLGVVSVFDVPRYHCLRCIARLMAGS